MKEDSHRISWKTKKARERERESSLVYMHQSKSQKNAGLELLKVAIAQAGYTDQVVIGMDVAASGCRLTDSPPSPVLLHILPRRISQGRQIRLGFQKQSLRSGRLGINLLLLLLVFFSYLRFFLVDVDSTQRRLSRFRQKLSG